MFEDLPKVIGCMIVTALAIGFALGGALMMMAKIW